MTTAVATRIRLVAGWLTVLMAMALLVQVPTTAAHAATDPTLTRYPYLTDATQSSMTINWATDTTGGTAGSVVWGPVGNCTANTTAATKTNITVIAKAQYQWKASIAVTPDTQYCYRVRLGAVDLLGSDPTLEFTSQVGASSTAPYSFAVMGDWGQAYAGGVNADQTNVLKQISQSGARFAVMTGDTAYPGGAQKEYGDLQQLGVDQSTVFGPTFWGVPGRSVPMFNVTGNHGFTNGAVQVVNWPEGNTAAASGGKYLMENYPSINGSTARSYPSFWYAFDAGPARYYILTAAWGDSNVGTGSVYQNDRDAHWTPSSPEYQWLQSDLAAHPNSVKMAFWHYPLYADSSGQPSDTFLQGGPGTLQGLLNANNVSVAFNGHAHGYQRNRPDSAGMRSYVVGNGGAALGSVSGCSTFDLYAIGRNGTHCGAAPATTPDAEVFGFVKVTVNGRTITVTPTSSTGRTYDVQTFTVPSSEPDSVKPTPPTTLTPTVVSTSRIDLTWSGATDNVGVTGYQIYRAEGTGTPVLLTEQSGTSYSDTTASPATDYTYSVWAIDAAGNRSDTAKSATASTAGAPDGTPPTQPGNLTATAPSSTVVNLSWSASTDNVGVTGYEVTRTNGTTTVVKPRPTVPDPNPQTTFTDETAQPGTTYTYAVSAFDSAGNESAKASKSVTTPAGGTTDTTPPTQPTNLTATPASSSSVNLSWTASTDAVGVTGYQISRGGTLITTVTTTSYSDTGLTASTAYNYSVIAVDAAGNKSPAATASATTPAAPGGGGTFTFAPTDDAYVDSSVPTATSGASTRLTVDNSPPVNTLLKFSVTGLPAGCVIGSAKLQLTVGNATDDKSPYGGDLYGSSDTSWTQAAVNWNTQPAAAATKTSSVATAVALSTAYSWDAKPLVTGNGLVSMVVKSTSGDGARYYSKEGGTAAQAPTLTVTCGAGGGGTTDTTRPTAPASVTANAVSSTQVNLTWPAGSDNVGVTGYKVYRSPGPAAAIGSPTALSYNDTTAAANTAYTYSVSAVDAAGNESTRTNAPPVTTPAAGGGATTLSFAPSADSYVDSTAGTTATNFGTATRVTVDNSPQSFAWLKFDVAGLPAGCAVSNATLQMTVGSSGTDNATYGGDLYGSSNTTWVESGTGGITWANQPAVAATKTSSVATAVALSTSYTWSATPLIAGNGTFSLVVKSTSSDGARYFSKEGSSTQAPKLTVTCG
jgi:fibronectin type 3 domain-containing protein